MTAHAAPAPAVGPRVRDVVARAKVNVERLQLLDRVVAPIVVTEPGSAGMAPSVEVLGGSLPRPPEPWETGFKDTVLAYPNEVMRIRAQFLAAGQFVWHCHIVEHEDNEMMRPCRVGPLQPGQPT